MKTKICILLFIAFNVLNVFGQINEFNQPWIDTCKAIIIDPYAGNSIKWDELLKDKRVVAIIHKTSQGLKSDKKYSQRKKIALDNGLLWGSYHLGVSGDPIEQADFYLNLIGNDPNVLMALDLEELDSTKFMTLSNAEKFIKRVYEKTGRYPLIYCNRIVLSEINVKYSSTSIFSNCGLWYARFRKNIPVFDKKIWETYSLWQFSCELNCNKKGECLYNVPGTEKDMDINIYNGSISQLKTKWPDIKK